MGCKRNRHLTVFLLGSLLCLMIVSSTDLLGAQKMPSVEPAFRITGTLEEGQIVAITVTPLEVVLPLTVKEKILAENESPRDYFLEMLDDGGNVALRMRLKDPTLVVMEYEDPDLPGHIISKRIRQDDGMFSILVPAPSQAKSVAFLRVRPGQESLPLHEQQHLDLGSFSLPVRQGQASPRGHGESS
jgi:hypothetical protein